MTKKTKESKIRKVVSKVGAKPKPKPEKIEAKVPPLPPSQPLPEEKAPLTPGKPTTPPVSEKAKFVAPEGRARASEIAKMLGVDPVDISEWKRLGKISTVMVGNVATHCIEEVRKIVTDRKNKKAARKAQVDKQTADKSVSG